MHTSVHFERQSSTCFTSEVSREYYFLLLFISSRTLFNDGVDLLSQLQHSPQLKFLPPERKLQHSTKIGTYGHEILYLAERITYGVGTSSQEILHPQ